MQSVLAEQIVAFLAGIKIKSPKLKSPISVEEDNLKNKILALEQITKNANLK